MTTAYLSIINNIHDFWHWRPLWESWSHTKEQTECGLLTESWKELTSHRTSQPMNTAHTTSQPMNTAHTTSQPMNTAHTTSYRSATWLFNLSYSVLYSWMQLSHCMLHFTSIVCLKMHITNYKLSFWPWLVVLEIGQLRRQLMREILVSILYSLVALLYELYFIMKIFLESFLFARSGLPVVHSF